MAANRLEGEVEITLDKRRILKLPWRAVALFSEKTGISVDKFLRGASIEMQSGDSPRFDYISILLWAMLIHEDRLLDVEKAEKLFEFAPGESMTDKTLYVMNKLFEVYSLRQGFDPKKAKDAEAGESENPPVPIQIENLRPSGA